LGSLLLAGALDDLRARGLKLVPLCPFVASYIRRHPEQADLIVRDPMLSD
jgi:predicted GNAT family acetyltransferase